jgi:hypothetical protein
MENEFKDTALMTKIKNLSQENQDNKTSISVYNTNRTEAEEALKEEISNKITLKAV